MAESWYARTTTLLIWAAAALCATYWGLRLHGAGERAAAIAPPPPQAPASDLSDVARVFGPDVAAAPASAASAAPVAVPDTRFVLVGVVAARSSRGVALIAIEGKAARPYRVGSPVGEGYTLRSVAVRSATLGPTATGGTTLTLELPPPGTATAPAAAPAAAGAAAPARAPASAPLLATPVRSS